MNEDYKNGIRFLMQKCRAAGIEIRKYPWVCDLSKILSEHGVCYTYWFNTYKQDRLTNIPLCYEINDIMYGDTTLFVWGSTSEGEVFWRSLLAFKLFNGYEEYTLDKLKLIQ